MIDQTLIYHSTCIATNSITAAKKTSIPNLYQVDSVFDQNHLVKLKEYVDTASPTWTSDFPGRQLVTWDGDTVVEELHDVCNNLTSTIIERFDFDNLNFLGIQLWRHNPGYHLHWHTDNSIINVALQVYLFDQAPKEYGTLFKHGDQTINVPYIHNSGYISVTKKQPGVLHSTPYTIEKNYTRYALYAIWSLSEKL